MKRVVSLAITALVLTSCSVGPDVIATHASSTMANSSPEATADLPEPAVLGDPTFADEALEVRDVTLDTETHRVVLDPGTDWELSVVIAVPDVAPKIGLQRSKNSTTRSAPSVFGSM